MSAQPTQYKLTTTRLKIIKDAAISLHLLNFIYERKSYPAILAEKFIVLL